MNNIQKKFQLLLKLIRFYQPTGFLLIMWPTICAVFLARDNVLDYQILILLVLGSFFIRSAGCIINDIIDKDFDKHVARTKNRPLASGELKVNEAIIFLLIFLLISLSILLSFNRLAIIIGFMALIPIIIYPHMKKYTYFPQLFLGITFNLGVLLSYAAVNNSLDIVAILFYCGCIFWTLGYDTIYAYQDISDDKKIGIKSTAIRFSKNPKLYIAVFYFMFLLFSALALVFKEVAYQKILFLLIPASHIFLQLRKFNQNNTQICGKIFHSNGLTGFLLLLSFMLVKYC